MEGRIASALRDLADALDELGEQRQKPESSSALEGRAASPGGRSQASWSVVTEPEGYKKGGAAQRAVAAGAGQPSPSTAKSSTVAYQQEVRAYIIVSNPHNPSYVGFTEGPSPQTWRRIEKHLPNERLCGSRVKLRRVANRAEALLVWAKAWPHKEMPDLPV